MITLNKLLLRTMGVFACVLSLPACANKDFSYSSLAIEDRVIEKETGKPVPNALVAVLWKGHLGWTGTVCYHVEATTTDDTGTYRTPAWKKTLPYGEIVSRYRAPTAYKQGYEYVGANKDTVYVKPFTGTKGERLEHLMRVSSATGCPDSGTSKRNLLPLKKTLYEEAKSIAATAEDQDKVETLLFGLESLEYGGVEALNRMTERRKVQK